MKAYRRRKKAATYERACENYIDGVFDEEQFAAELKGLGFYPIEIAAEIENLSEEKGG